MNDLMTKQPQEASRSVTAGHKPETNTSIGVSPNHDAPLGWGDPAVMMKLIETGSPLVALLLLAWVIREATNFVKAVRQQ